MNSRKTGVIVRWIDEKGFGFIRPDHQIDELFFHIRDYRGRQRPQVGDEIFYILDHDNKGRPCARNVQESQFVKQKIAQQNERYNIRQQRQQARDSKDITLDIMMYYALIYYILMVVFCFFSSGMNAKILLAVYTITSMITFKMYSIDKERAITNQRRIPENTLHFWAILGGWIGASIAQRQFNHKSSKKEFRMVFYGTMILNIIVAFSLLGKG